MHMSVQCMDVGFHVNYLFSPGVPALYSSHIHVGITCIFMARCMNSPGGVYA